MTAPRKEAFWISPEEYLEGEKDGDVRHEYVEGQVFAMAGASDDHGRIVLNIGSELRGRLRGKRCEAFTSDMKVRVPPAISRAYYYPDVVVACSPHEPDRYFREEPAVIFEVLSRKTERIDRSEKVTAYLQIPSLQAYVIVAQDRPSLVIRERVGETWKIRELTKIGDMLRLEAIGCELPLAEIYERVSWRAGDAAAK